MMTNTPNPKLWHCYNSRSLRALWTLEEMGVDYDIETLPFPPRFFQKEFLDINVLGTVPFFVDGETQMTESTGICHYLVERYQRQDLSVSVQHPEYGDYLNWLYHSDATLTFPQTVVMRYMILEPKERQLPQAVEDYGKWFIARLRRLDAHLLGDATSANGSREFLCDNRFTIADIAIAYALHLGDLLGLSKDYSPQVKRYLQQLRSRPAFQRAQKVDEHLNPFK